MNICKDVGVFGAGSAAARSVKLWSSVVKSHQGDVCLAKLQFSRQSVADAHLEYGGRYIEL